MNPALWVAKTGLDAQQTRMTVVSNNLANVNTTGFKKDRAVFQDLMYQTVRQAGGQSTQNTEPPSGLSLGTGVRVAATEKLQTQGNIVQTGNSLDVAIEGRGSLQVLQPDGTLAYTRDGTLQMDNQGQLVTSNGMAIQPAITLPSGTETVTIGQDGTVTAQVAGRPSPVTVGNLTLAVFVNPTGLQAHRRQPVRGNGRQRHAHHGTPANRVWAPFSRGRWRVPTSISPKSW